MMSGVETKGSFFRSGGGFFRLAGGRTSVQGDLLGQIRSFKFLSCKRLHALWQEKAFLLA